MSTPLSGPGVGLPLPQSLYPTALLNAPLDTNTNRVCLAPGEELPIAAGTWYVGLGAYLTLEYLDPVTNLWAMGSGAAFNRGFTYLKSDGFNVRVANRTGCPIGGVVIAYGSAYVQATTTVTAVPGNSTWAPIVGGQLSLPSTTLGIPNAGAGFGVAPIVIIPAPPPAASNANGVGGIQASGYATIASGTVSGFTFTNPGAGYPSAFSVIAVPNPTDPNANTGITNATISFSVVGSGSITGVLCTNPGAPLANPAQISLVLAGAGSSGSVAAIVLQTVTAVSVTGLGLGYPASSTLVGTTAGGGATAGTITNNPDYLGLGFIPRPANVGLVSSGAGGTLATQLGTIYDGGLFASTPFLNVIATPGVAPTTVGTLSMTMGSRADIATIQPAP